jgi:hypothetical protein
MTHSVRLDTLIVERENQMVQTEIHIKGKIDPNWSDWFENMKLLEKPSGDTMLCGNLPDKSAVYGVISKLSNLGIALISVTCEEATNHGPPLA